MCQEALLVSHVQAVCGPDDYLVLFDFIFLSEGLLADDALLVLLLLAVGLHDFIFILARQLVHHSSQVHVSLTSHINLLLFEPHIDVRILASHSSSHHHRLGSRLLKRDWIYRLHRHWLLIDRSNWNRLRLLHWGYICWLLLSRLLSRRGDGNSCSFHLVDNGV